MNPLAQFQVAIDRACVEHGLTPPSATLNGSGGVLDDNSPGWKFLDLTPIIAEPDNERRFVVDDPFSESGGQIDFEEPVELDATRFSQTDRTAIERAVVAFRPPRIAFVSRHEPVECDHPELGVVTRTGWAILQSAELAPVYTRNGAELPVEWPVCPPYTTEADWRERNVQYLGTLSDRELVDELAEAEAGHRRRFVLHVRCDPAIPVRDGSGVYERSWVTGAVITAQGAVFTIHHDVFRPDAEPFLSLGQPTELTLAPEWRDGHFIHRTPNRG